MDDRQAVLVRILADTDALWLPNRRFTSPRTANIYFGRMRYPKSGVPWTSNEPREADRKAAQRMLEELQHDGLVIVRRPRRVKTLCVRLMDAAEWQARALCDLPGLSTALLAMAELASHSKRPAEFLTDAWVSELKMVGDVPSSDYRNHAAAVAATLFLPCVGAAGIAFDPEGFMNISVPAENLIHKVGPALPGDMNGDGAVTLLDLDGFVAALLLLPDAPPPIATADMNGDGCANGLDIRPFMRVLGV